MKQPSRYQAILLRLLSSRKRSGPELLQAFENASGGTKLRVGAFYMHLHRMADAGWITASDAGEGKDGRLRHFAISGAGSRALEEATEAAEGLVRALRVAARLRVQWRQP